MTLGACDGIMLSTSDGLLSDWAPETAKRLAAYSRSLVVRAGVATCVATSPALLAPCGNLASEGLPNPERDGCGPPP